jgi:hypothetical protein
VAVRGPGRRLGAELTSTVSERFAPETVRPFSERRPDELVTPRRAPSVMPRADRSFVTASVHHGDEVGDDRYVAVAADYAGSLRKFLRLESVVFLLISILPILRLAFDSAQGSLGIAIDAALAPGAIGFSSTCLARAARAKRSYVLNRAKLTRRERPTDH